MKIVIVVALVLVLDMKPCENDDENEDEDEKRPTRLTHAVLSTEGDPKRSCPNSMQMA